MSRGALIAFALSLACALGLAAFWRAGAAVMPSYLAAWLFLIAMPVGALPVLMTIDLVGARKTPVERPLRAMAAWLPLAALLVVPVLLRARDLYPGLAASSGVLPAWWTTPGAFIGRAIVILAVWTWLGLTYSKPSGDGAPRPRLALLGLLAHAVLGTVAMDDWAMAVEPDFASGAFGLAVLTALSAIALSVAVLLALRPRPGPPALEHLSLPVLVVLGCWCFLQFTQYLVVWSANLPSESAWYLRRSAGIGQAFEYAAGVVCLLATAALLSATGPRRSGLLIAATAGLCLLHAVEMLWLITPAYRGRFDLTPADGLALVGFAALGWGCTLAMSRYRRTARRTDDAAA